MFISRINGIRSEKRSDDVSLSSRNQIIIGVVVGGVVFIAITAGTIIFFHIRKRKQNHHTTKHDQQLLPLHIPPAYKTNSVMLYPSIPSEQRSSQSYSQPYTQEGRSEPEQLPAYQPKLPTYDPSKYQNVDRPLPTMEIGRQSIGPSILNPVHYPDPRMSFQPMDDRLTIRRLSGETSVEFGRRPSGMSSYLGTSSWEQRRPSMQSSDTFRSNGIDRPLSFDESDETPLSRPHEEENRRPRRPRPALSRLITNFS